MRKCRFSFLVVAVTAFLLRFVAACGDTSGDVITSADGGGTLGPGQTVDCSNGPNYTGCPCALGDVRTCYTGPSGTAGIGSCRTGTQTCTSQGELNTTFGACTGEVIPSSGDNCAGNDGGSRVGDDGGSPSSPPPPLCAAAADGGIQPYESPASGSVSGPDVNCQICNVGAYVGTDQVSNAPILWIGTGGTVQCDKPLSGGLLTVGIDIAAASPGVYTNADPQNGCGSIGFLATLPGPAVNCNVSPCPAVGCGLVCAGDSCTCTSAGSPTLSYAASPPLVPTEACAQNQSAPAAGSWTITLTSVAPVHGTLRADLVDDGADGGPESATLSLAF